MAFIKGDQFRLQAALSEIRKQYEESKTISEPDQIQEKLQLAKDVNLILRQNVVQGVPSEHDPSTYKLNIHSETELGFNDTVKKNSKRPTTDLSKGGCCGGSGAGAK